MTPSFRFMASYSESTWQSILASSQRYIFLDPCSPSSFFFRIHKASCDHLKCPRSPCRIHSCSFSSQDLISGLSPCLPHDSSSLTFGLIYSAQDSRGKRSPSTNREPIDTAATQNGTLTTASSEAQIYRGQHRQRGPRRPKNPRTTTGNTTQYQEHG